LSILLIHIIEHQHLALTEVGRDLNYLMFSYISRKFIIVKLNKFYNRKREKSDSKESK